MAAVSQKVFALVQLRDVNILMQLSAPCRGTTRCHDSIALESKGNCLYRGYCRYHMFSTYTRACAQRPGLPRASRCHSGELACLALLGRSASVAGQCVPRLRLRQSFQRTLLFDAMRRKYRVLNIGDTGRRCTSTSHIHTFSCKQELASLLK